jgi:hypothetical protein
MKAKKVGRTSSSTSSDAALALQRLGWIAASPPGDNLVTSLVGGKAYDHFIHSAAAVHALHVQVRVLPLAPNATTNSRRGKKGASNHFPVLMELLPERQQRIGSSTIPWAVGCGCGLFISAYKSGPLLSGTEKSKGVGSGALPRPCTSKARR